AVHQGVVYFTNYKDQVLYVLKDGAEPQAITKAGPWRFADMVVDEKGSRIICVCEDHSDTINEPENKIVSIDLQGSPGSIEPVTLVSGHDFFSGVRLSFCGRKLAYLAWDHPNMPWDGTYLYLADLDKDGLVADKEIIAGGVEESIFQPSFSPQNVLYFVSDAHGYWSLYRFDGKQKSPLVVDRLPDKEFGMPLWVFGMSTYAFLADSTIVCAYNDKGIWHLGIMSATGDSFAEIETPYTDFAYVVSDQNMIAMLAGSPTTAQAVVSFEPHARRFQVLRQNNSINIDSGYMSVPEVIEFPTSGGKCAYAFYYAPTNKDFQGEAGELPPLLVKSHGGPTGSTSSSLNLVYQYFTSRGFAVVDVNYGGSTGYGRQYMKRLEGNWGVVDVDDCENAALYLVENGKADGKRLAITGGSAGGYTTLCVLTFRDTFAAGASHFGIGDLESLALETHKFESRYGDRLIGPYPQQKALYYERSPIHFTDRLNCPLIIFQGLEDKVVPPSQAESMVSALRAKKMPVAYIAYEG
ncbi:MAG: prolyl oligopeptidase family serine peptidase, partial [Candidatus Obscuribacterales bacterium]|nr:prolyl oligopeptidase family serine peptidase [Candidatus Obscuribacterales bacterium]